MALPLIPIILALMGGAAADQTLNDGNIASGLGGIFAGTAADIAGGAADFAIEPIISMIIHDETLSEQISEAITSGDFNAAWDLLSDNFDQVNFQGFAGLIAGGYFANSIAGSLGVSGASRLAVVAGVAGLAATATTRLWGALEDGNLTAGSIFDAVLQGQGEANEVLVQQQPEVTTQPEVLEPVN